jgi:hypothetical protein
LCLCLTLPVLGGWSNGAQQGNGFGTHDWILSEANRLAVDGGVQWLDWAVAQPVTDDPDMVLHDTYHHVYDIWGSTYGDAPTRVQELYDETVAALRAGDRATASADFGLLSHYYSDICEPLHTDQSLPEEAMHDNYEQQAQTYTDEPGENSKWVVADGLQYVPDATLKTQEAAILAHESFAPLVSEYNANRRGPDVMATTEKSLDQAANGLADLMYSIARDAQVADQLQSGKRSDSATAPASVTTSALAVAAAPPAADQNLATMFWLISSAAFACALWGALGAKKAA